MINQESFWGQKNVSWIVVCTRDNVTTVLISILFINMSWIVDNILLWMSNIRKSAYSAEALEIIMKLMLPFTLLKSIVSLIE